MQSQPCCIVRNLAGEEIFVFESDINTNYEPEFRRPTVQGLKHWLQKSGECPRSQSLVRKWTPVKFMQILCDDQFLQDDAPIDLRPMMKDVGRDDHEIVVYTVVISTIPKPFERHGLLKKRPIDFVQWMISLGRDRLCEFLYTCPEGSFRDLVHSMDVKSVSGLTASKQFLRKEVFRFILYSSTTRDCGDVLAELWVRERRKAEASGFRTDFEEDEIQTAQLQPQFYKLNPYIVPRQSSRAGASAECYLHSLEAFHPVSSL
eukprot:TRINITY_DN2455_c0_g1_i1.p1 TRINITY_DN2455_c0_g1~~TRINITY_DN2455_c0_g1_i1.p1  ORF type:complete len:261 (-),score=24.69 TRINITY_DN2455_c0_g1_i1:669-1451(-)